MTTTTNGTIKYKISFEKPSVTKEAAESSVKEKKPGSYYLLPLETFHLTKITEIFTTSAQFKSINEVLKFSISTLIKQTARFNADLENVRAKTVVLVISYFLKLTSQEICFDECYWHLNYSSQSTRSR